MGAPMMDFLVRFAIAPDWARHLPGDPLGFDGGAGDERLRAAVADSQQQLRRAQADERGVRDDLGIVAPRVHGAVHPVGRGVPVVREAARPASRR